MTIIEQAYNLLHSTLLATCPVLSGNMKQHIETGKISEHEMEIIIKAPFYDMKEWNKNHRIVHTKQEIKGYTDYAFWVNKSGAFGTGNKSKGWVNRSCIAMANTLAAELRAEGNEVEIKNLLGD